MQEATVALYRELDIQSDYLPLKTNFYKISSVATHLWYMEKHEEGPQ